MAAIGVTMKNSRSSPTTLVHTLIKIVFGTARALIHANADQFISIGFIIAGSGCIIWERRMSRREFRSEIADLMAAIKTEIGTEIGAGVAVLPETRTEITGIKADIPSVKADIAVVNDKVEYSQSMVMGGGHHIMKALDGNKQPMRQWLQEMKDCKESSKVDCNPTRKA